MKSLVIYFSRAGENYAVGNVEKGNTEVVAQYIAQITGADLFKCQPVKPYSSKYSECCKEALALRRQNARPQLERYLDGIDGYDVIYIGGPVYFGEYPYDLYSQTDRLDFSGKIVKPFTTHEGSGLALCVEALKTHCKGATIMPGLAVEGKTVNLPSAREQVEGWVER